MEIQTSKLALAAALLFAPAARPLRKRETANLADFCNSIGEFLPMWPATPRNLRAQNGRKACARPPPGKQSIALRLDKQVLAAFKAQRPGWQSRMLPRGDGRM